MSNIKRVLIEGEIPFDYAQHDKITHYIGQMAGPTFGLKITFGKGFYVPNENGGKTATYPYQIFGEEAVGHRWIEGLLQAMINAGGTITNFRSHDIENDERLIFEIPTLATPEEEQSYFFETERGAGYRHELIVTAPDVQTAYARLDEYLTNNRSLNRKWKTPYLLVRLSEHILSLD